MRLPLIVDKDSQISIEDSRNLIYIYIPFHKITYTVTSGSMTTDHPTSVSLISSIQDWWSYPKKTSQVKEKSSSENEKLRSNELKSRIVEYELFRKVFTSSVYLCHPAEDSEVPADEKYVGQFLDVDIGDDLAIHEFYLENRSSDVPEGDVVDVVVIHGYMAALGYFIKNYEQIVKSKDGVRLHAIDLPGFGNSSRPPFPPSLLDDLSPLDEIEQIKQIENWFIDKIELWRKKRGIKSFKLIAHSMGAYLASCYLMKYNNPTDPNTKKIVEEVVMVSPLGTETSYASLLSPNSLHALGGNPLKEFITRESGETVEIDPELERLWQYLGKPRAPLIRILQHLWKWKISPFEVLQYLGPFYSKILSYWSYARFQNLKANDDSGSGSDLISSLHNYSFSVFNQYPRSGELAIVKIITFEILAKLPLSDRGLIEYLHDQGIKTLWMYGEKDWMNFKGGKFIHDKLSEKGASSSFLIVPRAGHHIYLDNSSTFNSECINFLNLK